MKYRADYPLWALGALLLTALGASTTFADTRVEGDIRGEVTWDKKGSPYVVVGDVFVKPGATLSITRGTEVRFKPNIRTDTGVNAFDLEILVEGSLVVEGAEKDTVYFTSDAERARWGDWQGIVVTGEGAKAEIRAAKIEFANIGVVVLHGAYLEAKNVTVQGCTGRGISFENRAKGKLENVYITSVGDAGGNGIGINQNGNTFTEVKGCYILNSQTGISYGPGCTGILEDTIVTLNSNLGVGVTNSSPTVRRCTLTQNLVGIYLVHGSHPIVVDNNIFDNAEFDAKIRSYGKEPVKIDLKDNWWGVDALGIIEERVSDGVDEPEANGFALLSPFRSTAVTAEDQ